MRKFYAFWIAVAILCTTFIACDESNTFTDEDNVNDNIDVIEGSDKDVFIQGPVTIQGIVAGGPVLQDTSVGFYVRKNKNTNPPTVEENLVFTAKTNNALGHFSYQIAGKTVSEISQRVFHIFVFGYFYDKSTDRLSNAPITLESMVRITTTETQNFNINLITHLTTKRTLNLMTESGMWFEDAQKQAEDEFILEMGIIYPTDESPRKQANQMDLMNDAYLLATECILSQMVYNTIEDTDEYYIKYEQLLNEVADDLVDGKLSTVTKNAITVAEETVDINACVINLQNWEKEKTDTVYTFADPNESVDSDKDGISNKKDPDIDNDGIENILDCVNGPSDYKFVSVNLSGIFVAKKDNSWTCYKYDYTENDEISVAWSGNSFTQIATGRLHWCGIATDKALWCWGNFTADDYKYTPQKMNDSSWKKVFAGQQRTCAINTADQLFCWQNNLSVPGIKVNDDADWNVLSLGNDKFYALKKDGTLWSWNFEEAPAKIGSNQWTFVSNTSLYGLQVNGTLWYLSDIISPIQVGADSDWKAVYGTCAIKADNTTWCWTEEDKTPAIQTADHLFEP